MKTAYCLDCERPIRLGNRYDVDDAVECPHCESEFQIVSLDPPELEWLYDEDDIWEEEEEEEEEEEDEIDSWLHEIAKQSRIRAYDRMHEHGRNHRGRRSYDYEYDY